jgi:hypothetical protein
MTRSGRVRQFVTIAFAAAGVSCGGGGSNGGGGNGGIGGGPGPSPLPQVCRTYPTAANVHTETTASKIVFDALVSGTFDTGSKKSTVTTMFANGAPCSTNITDYASVADFVDEVHVVPPIFRSTSNTNTNSGACGKVTATNTYTYDGQRRLVSMSNDVGGVTTYTAWDTAGRPTKGTSNGSITISNAYDDGARTTTQTQTGPNGKSVTTMTFDANGAQLQSVVTSGKVTTTTTFTNTATATVCN